MNNLLAPNGKPSNLTPEQYKLVRTPAFKKWFGDWENDPENASKVVDENGEPLIKYRGDNNPKNIFDYVNYGGYGVYYFGDKNYAESYGDKLSSYFINSRNPFIPNKLNKKEENEIRNLLEKDANEILNERIQEGVFKNLYDYLDNYYLIEAGFSENSNSLDIIVWQLKNGINYFILELKPIIEWIKNNDYDGYESYEGNNDNIAVFNSNQIKLADGSNTTFDSNNPDIRFKMGGQPFEYTQSKVVRSKLFMPNVRGGWTKEKIIKYLKSHSSDIISTYRLVKYISEFENWQQFKEHIFYHGTSNYIEKGLKPSITMSEREAERSGGGGYGERYFGVSLTSRKRTAESFSGMSSSVSIYPVILKRDAYVIERTDLQDASEIEDIIVELYEQGVDAVWIGGGEEELVVINPFSVLLYKKGREGYSVFGGFKSIPLSDEKIKEIYDTSLKLWESYSTEYNKKENKQDREDYLRSLPTIQFELGGNINFDSERYKQVEKEMYELRKNKKVDSAEYFKLIKERAMLEKQIKIKNSNTEYGKGGKVNMLPADTQKFGRIGVTDKYIIEATKDVGLQGINFDSNSILKRISASFESMLHNYKDYLISEDSPSITNYINNEIATHKEQGSSIETIQRLEQKIDNQSERNGIINDIAKTQEETLIQWVAYLRDSQYPIPFKFLMLKAVYEYNYDIKQNKLFERGKDTIRNFTPFDAGTLAELFDNQSDYLLMEYNVILNENANKIFNSKEIVAQSGDGKWIKFNGGKKTKPQDISKNGKELMQLVQNTYWCTKTAGTSQLAGGDFYVYVTEKNGEVFPRIAVRMKENEVGEVRGNKSSAQDIEEDMLPIAEEFLVKNIPNNSGKKWLDSIKFNKRCVALKNRMEKEGLFKDFIFEYVELLSLQSSHSVDYGNNGNVANLIETFNKQKLTLPNEFYDKGDIEDDYNYLSPKTKYFIGDINTYVIINLQGRYNVQMNDLYNWKLEYVSGNFNCNNTNINNLGNLKFVGKDLILSNKIQDLGEVKHIGNKFQLNGSLITSLKNLEYMGGDLVVTSQLKDLGKLKKVSSLQIQNCDVEFSLNNLEEIENDFIINVTDKNINFGNLKKIGGNFMATKTLITELKNLENVGGDFIIAGSKIKEFGNLKSIGGNADFSNNFASSTQKIETILGNVKFLNSRIMEFPNLIRIGGEIEFRGSYFKSFGAIKNIGGNIKLDESKIEDLGDLEAVGGYMSFKGSNVKTLNKLKKITQFAHFEGSMVEDLGDLEVIGGNAYFQNSKVKSLGKLNYIGGSVIQFGTNKKLEEEWTERKK